jgi:anti-sigma B factor antagonist/stage II sporulation protein AA (anti-sigma F factor antagonist)
VEFSSRKVADVVVAVPVGKLDHNHAILFEEELAPIVGDAAAAKAPVVLDFTGVDYISSMGLRVLMVASKKMRARETPLAVAGLQPTVEEIFGIARFNHVVQVFPSVRAALEKLSASAAAAYDATAR